MESNNSATGAETTFSSNPAPAFQTEESKADTSGKTAVDTALIAIQEEFNLHCLQLAPGWEWVEYFYTHNGGVFQVPKGLIEIVKTLHQVPPNKRIGFRKTALGFFAALFKQHNDLLGQWTNYWASHLTNEEREYLFWPALRLAGPEGNKMLHRVVQTKQQLQGVEQKYPSDVLDVNITDGSDFNYLFGAFYATGQPEAIYKVWQLGINCMRSGDDGTFRISHFCLTKNRERHPIIDAWLKQWDAELLQQLRDKRTKTKTGHVNQ